MRSSQMRSNSQNREWNDGRSENGRGRRNYRYDYEDDGDYWDFYSDYNDDYPDDDRHSFSPYDEDYEMDGRYDEEEDDYYDWNDRRGRRGYVMDDYERIGITAPSRRRQWKAGNVHPVDTRRNVSYSGNGNGRKGFAPTGRDEARRGPRKGGRSSHNGRQSSDGHSGGRRNAGISRNGHRVRYSYDRY